MNLYKHTFKHWSQKDSEVGIKGYFLAENDREAYNIVYGEYGCMTVDRFSYHENEDGEPFQIDYVEYDYNQLTEDDVRNIVIEKRGELNFDDLDSLNCWDDLYYGLTLEGWELVVEHVKTSELLVLTDLGIIKEKD